MNELTEGTPLTCAQCGAPVSAMHRQAGYRLTRCRRCSALLQINSERTATKVMTIEMSGVICPLCTHVNPDSNLPQQFCNNCATALKKPCRACANPVALIDNFCGRCRADQTGAAGPSFERPATVMPPAPTAFGLPPINGYNAIVPPNVPIYSSQPQLPMQTSRVVYNPALGLGPQVYNGNATPATPAVPMMANPMQAQALTFVQSAQAHTALTPIDESQSRAIVESKRQKVSHAAIASGTVSGVIALLNMGSGYSYYYSSGYYGAHAFWNVVAAGFLFLTVCLMTYRARLGTQQERGIKVYDSQDARNVTTLNGSNNKLATRPFQTPMGLTVSFLGGMGLVIGMMTNGLSGVIGWGMAELFLGGGFLVFAFVAAWVLKQLGLND